MTILKQKTVKLGRKKQKIVLKKLKNTYRDISNNKWMYTVEDKTTGEKFGDPLFNKKKAKRRFSQTVKDIKRGMQKGENSDMFSLW